MGGLLIKLAYILARQKPEFAKPADQVKPMFFPASPHRGSDLAHVLSKVLNLSPGARPFVTDLHRNSMETQSINDEFPQFYQEIQLCSFCETLAINYGLGKSLIVGQDLATLGHPNESREYLMQFIVRSTSTINADDPNYRTFRNALASVMDVLRSRSASAERSAIISDICSIHS